MNPMNKEDVETRRQQLRAAQADCLAKMSARGRCAFEQRHHRGAGLANAGERQEERETNSQLADKINSLVAEARRLRQKAESNRDDRAAFRGLDTELRALQLYGKTTGEISTARRATKPRADVVPTREEGVETATDLLLALATADEIAAIMQRLEGHLLELNSAAVVADGSGNGCSSSAPAERSELTESEFVPDWDLGDLDI